ncbi:MAG: riboflavin synthase [Rhodospirillaceae bacterium]|jgi:riboflavin synthase|nr:riboflavin synthase [Rhodospirillaceae bacterium]MBT6307555.1 riboflavin synthase [Rhodospirillaceae bacterium]MBT7731812.1 riboflavin synthase [Rhodospirillaceae bacterium]
MFTGIITDVGRVQGVVKTGDLKVFITTTYNTEFINIGASICCSGICLTVVEKASNWFAVEVSKETLDNTTSSSWVEGTSINLERSLQLKDELGGHIVSGHVDGRAQLVNIEKEGGSHRLLLDVPSNLAKFIASKGSVTLEGVSLTVNEVQGSKFGVNIIPHTWDNTSFKYLRDGAFLNIEVDVIARYVARLINSKESD